jgi:hypothetical protein
MTPALANSVVRNSDEESFCPSSRIRAKLLAARCMGVPSIHVLLYVLIGEHRFKRPAMQVEVEHIRSGKRRLGKRADK